MNYLDDMAVMRINPAVTRLGKLMILRDFALYAMLLAVLGITGSQSLAQPVLDGARKLEAYQTELEAAEKGSARWQEASLKYGRLAHHLRKFATAKKVLSEFIAASSEHPAAKEVRTLLENIRARFQVERCTIGVLLPLSGPFQRYGRQVQKGIELALSEKGCTKLEFFDTRGEADRAREGVAKLVLEHRAIALLGPVGEQESLAAAEVAEQYQVPILTMTRREGITGAGEFVFRNYLTNKMQGQAMARYSMQVLGLRRFAILYPNNKYGDENMRAFWDEVVKLGGKITAVERYAPSDRDHQEAVRKLVGSWWLELRPDMWKGNRGGAGFKQRKERWSRAIKNIKPVIDFDGIFIPDFWNRLVFVLPWLKYYDVEFHTENVVRLDRLKLKYRGKVPKMVWLLGTNGWNSERLHKRIGDFVWRAVFCDAVHPYSDDPAWTSFVNKFKDRHGTTPHFLQAIGFDSLRILAGAIEKSGGATREAVRDQLRLVKDFPGATGVTSFTSGDVEKTLKILTVDRSRADVNRYDIAPARMDAREPASEEDSHSPEIKDGEEGAAADTEPAVPVKPAPKQRPRRRGKPAPEAARETVED